MDRKGTTFHILAQKIEFLHFPFVFDKPTFPDKKTDTVKNQS